MDFNNLRAYIEKHNVCGKDIYLFEKPFEIKANTYILYNFKEINGAQTTRDYQVDFRIVSKDVLEVVNIKEQLIQLLDFYDRQCDIEGIRVFKLLNGGGIAFDDRNKEYNAFLYFKAII